MGFAANVALIVSLCIGSSWSLDNGLALTPPMGWLVWERFACNTDCVNDPENCVSEKLFMEMADHLANDGFKDVGYEYINIDDCWAEFDRDSNGRLVANLQRFPNGIAYLADYVHSLGLKLGIYGDIGTYTCGGYPGTEDHITTDAQTFASWGVDMLKLDGCNIDTALMPTVYPAMTAALNATGRPIVFSCSWPAYISDYNAPNYTAIAEYCNLWRNFDDVYDAWVSIQSIIDHYSTYQDVFQPYAGPGHWNDPDMLMVGNYGLSLDEQKVQMALWAIFAAPLFMSTDLRILSDDSRKILQNTEVININQDKHGVQGKLVLSYPHSTHGAPNRKHSLKVLQNPNNVYVRPLSNGSIAAAFLNLYDFGYPTNITSDLPTLGITATNKVFVRDVLEQQDLGVFTNSITVLVNLSGVRLLKLTPV